MPARRYRFTKMPAYIGRFSTSFRVKKFRYSISHVKKIFGRDYNAVVQALKVMQ